MSSLLPLQVATPRTPAAPSAAPERRSDVPRADFANSLATARRDAASARQASRDTDVRARSTASDRSQVQALMLSGAMRYAATRTDCGTSAQLPADLTVASLPDAPPAAELADDVTGTPQSPVALAPAPDTDAPTAPQTSAMLGSDVRAQSLPDAPAADDATLVAPDLSAMPAATIAAYQLVATLPLVQPMDVPEVVDAAESEPALTEQQQGDGLPEGTEPTIREPNRRALMAQAAALVEDHFDVPAVAQTVGVTPTDAVATSGTQPDAPTAGDAAATTTPATAATAATAATTTTAPTAAADATAATASETPASDAVRGLRRTHASTEVLNDLAALDPEFREKLERVIERMRKEFGRTVTVVETARSQARQDQLYAQGRTAPGPVVTWTRNSRHTKGMAADLMVDGAWDNPAGYATLARVARDEGLRTLGARDPGHVELAGEGSVSSDTLESLLNDLQGGAPQGGQGRLLRGLVQRDDDAGDRLAQVANVAQVARVATVAQVANVAQVARVASVARPGAGSHEGAAQSGDMASALAIAAPGPVNAVAAAAGVAPTTASGSVAMADRITQLMDLQATQASRPLNSVLLRMQDANGVEDRIRIDARGTAVGAQLGMGDAQQAAALTESVNELRAALERRGLTTEGVRVQAAPRPTDSVQFSRPTASVLDLVATRAAGDAQMQGGTRDQASRDQQQREAFAREQQARTPQRSSSDDPRHRSRREQPEARS